jgi:trypsin
MLPLILLVVGVFAQQTFAEEPEAIVGGTLAAPGEFPHQCSLRVSGNHICGCSIIGPNTILTAAHCVYNIVYAPYNNFKIATGTTSVSGGQLHTVRTVHVHPDYVDSVNYAWVNDIAVIKLAASIQYNTYQSPIALTNSAPVTGQTCTLSGWGKTSTNGPLARDLLKMNQKLVSLQECKQRHRMPLTDSHLCSFNTRGIGACQGDSGGPLICNGRQYGITSWVLPCAQGEPDAYTNVYHHLNFIRQYL